MRRRCPPVALFLPALLAGGGAAATESLRCGNAFVRAGLEAEEVRERCGEPAELIVVDAADGDEEHWIYRTRWSLDARLLVFRNGDLIRIERVPEARPGAAAI